MTLAGLGQLTDLSPGYLSQIERGLTTPSLHALRSIAHAFNVPLTDLLSAGERTGGNANGSIRRRSDRVPGRYPGTEVCFELMSHPDMRTEMMWVTAPPQARMEPHRRAIPGEECALVISGRMRVFLDGAEETLEPGDAVFIDAQTVVHGWENAGDEPLVAVWVVNPPF